jgi:hypothetical protein
MKVDKYRYQFNENDIEIKAEEHTLIALAKALREANVEGTLSDLAYQIEYEFDIDGVRSEDEEYEIDRLYHDASEDELREMGAFDNLHEDDYTPSAEGGDYSPNNP